MSRTLLPFQLRPHLVCFFYQHFDSEEIEIYGKKVKSVKIHTRSVLGRYIRMMLTKAKLPIRNTEFNLVLSINDSETSKIYDSEVFQFVDGRKTFLCLPDAFCKDLNELLQKMFETALYYYIEGYRAQGKYGAMREAARKFIDLYELYEHGYNYSTIEQIYMRAKRNNKAFAKLTTQPK